MTRKILAMFVAGMAFAGNVHAQVIKPEPDPALNNPDKLSWELFVQVTKPAATTGNNNVLFETWASDEDTFQQNPLFPGSTSPPVCATGPAVEAAAPPPGGPGVQLAGASPKILKVPALQRLAPPRPGGQLEATVGGSEEVRRNQATFNFIYCNKLYRQAGLKAAFAAGKPISFPTDSIEVKANWVPASSVEQLLYHVNTASDGKQYALVSMHIISKLVPNWTWATFEHRNNAGRCDFIGCRDDFGAKMPLVKAHGTTGQQYPACEKTDALKAMFNAAGLPALWQNYCLKGSQVDFTTATGVPTLLGNSVTENGFVNTSSCMSCHSRASVLASGEDAQGAGFIDPPVAALCPSGPNASCSPNGTPNPTWFWNNPGQPNQTMKAMQTDFIWAIPLAAVP
ncbi:hypothetical protein [uncultured Bradyrhizobium sp.]|uniref:hypothetical protein n=1 Tax=uncultured Bradyrhizobium sp. TaxID=199684 RepID=UPI0035CCA416